MVVSLVDLPYLCLKEIFERLNYDSICVCRQVCKTFQFFSSQIVISELVVNDEFESVRDRWFYTGGLIEKTTAITTTLFLLKCTELKQNLKRLHLNSRTNGVDLRILNELQQLEQLHLLLISGSTFHADAAVVLLSLPNLRICNVGIRTDRAYQLTLKAPKLAHLKCTWPNTLRFIQLLDYNTIKHLEVDGYSPAVGLFANVKRLQINHLLRADHLIDREILRILERLEDLNMNCNSPCEKIYTLLKEDLMYIMSQLPELRRSVVITVNGLPFDENILLSGTGEDFGLIESLHGMDSTLVAQMKHYDRLATDLPFVTEISYNSLMHLVNHVLPRDFFERFHNIRLVKTERGLNNATQFIHFLSNLRCLEELSLNGSCLSQHFLDQLPDVCGQIVRFTFCEYRRLPINFAFLYKFALLTEFSTNKNFSCCWLLKALKNVPNAKSFHFKSQDLTVEIHNLRDYYRCECSGRYRESHMASLDAVIAFIKELQGRRELERQ